MPKIQPTAVERIEEENDYVYTKDIAEKLQEFNTKDKYRIMLARNADCYTAFVMQRIPMQAVMMFVISTFFLLIFGMNLAEL